MKSSLRRGSNLRTLLAQLKLMAAMNFSEMPQLEDTLKGIKVPSERFMAGDQFYNNLRYKRVNGKWKVRK